MVTRAGIFSFLALLMLNFAEKNWYRRVGFILLGIPIAILIFYSSAFQQKTFFSGKGTIEDITINYYTNEAINSTGRITWYRALEQGLIENPLWGNGPRSDNLAFQQFGFEKGEGHNDYLTVRFNYGWIGLSILLLGFLLQFLHLYKIRNKFIRNLDVYTIWASTMALFFCFFTFMYSDNILKYTIFFPNIFFAMIGILYGSYSPNNTELLKTATRTPNGQYNNSTL
jgi:O-antigen ligase